MKIIKQGIVRKKEEWCIGLHLKCDKCYALFEIEQEDVDSQLVKIFREKRIIYTAEWIECNCPTCNNIITVHKG